jgi:hypothetical protein
MSNLSSLVAVVEDELEMPSLSMLKWANVIHAARAAARARRRLRARDYG